MDTDEFLSNSLRVLLDNLKNSFNPFAELAEFKASAAKLYAKENP